MLCYKTYEVRSAEGDCVSGMAVTLNMCVICNVWWCLITLQRPEDGEEMTEAGRREGDCTPMADLRNRQLPLEVR